MSFDPIDFEKFNKPPFYPSYLARGETKTLVSFSDEQFEELDRLINKASDQYDLDKAKGIILDRLGKLKDVPREGNEDELYRLLIRLKILLDTTNCSVPDIIRIIKFIYSSAEVRLRPNYPAGIMILHDGNNDDIDFNKYISQIVGAGIAYEARSLFNFYDRFIIIDFSQIKVTKNISDRFFLPPIRRDGTHKRDGTIKRNRSGRFLDYFRGRAVMYQQLEKLQIRGFFELKVYRNGTLIESFFGENKIVNGAYIQLGHLMTGDVDGRSITSIAFGTNGTAPTIVDAEITNQFAKSISGYAVSEEIIGLVQIKWDLGITENNGMAIREFGLQTKDETLFARITRETPLHKESDISLEGTWTIALSDVAATLFEKQLNEGQNG